jgi:hypothetical protein
MTRRRDSCENATDVADRRIGSGGRDDDTRPRTFLDLSVRDALEEATMEIAGIGFLPDGRLLVNSMFERVVLDFDGSTTSVYADLRELEGIADDGRRA